MQPISCWVIENDLDQRRSIIAALRYALAPEFELTSLLEFDDMENANDFARRSRLPWRRRAAHRAPDLILVDLFRRDRHDLAPREIAEIIATKRVAILNQLRAHVGPRPVMVVVSQYVDYFLRAMADIPGAAQNAIDRISSALKESDASISYVIDKFSPADVDAGFSVVKEQLGSSRVGGRDGEA